MLIPSARPMLEYAALFYGNIGPVLAMIIFVILIFKIPEAAWHGHLNRKTYAGMLLLGATLGVGLFHLWGQWPPWERTTGYIPDGAAWGTAVGSLFALLFYRSSPKKHE